MPRWELSGIQDPPGASIRLGERMLENVPALLADIRSAAEYCSAHPSEVLHMSVTILLVLILYRVLLVKLADCVS